MILSGFVATSVIEAFEKAGWKVRHRFDYNPWLVNRLGLGDRRYLKGDDDPRIRLPEPNLALMQGSTGIICEVDFKYSKASFGALSLVRQTKKKKSYLRSAFGSRAPTRLLYGLAMPDLDLHVQRSLSHLPEVDFLLVAGGKRNVYCLKRPECDVFGTFASIPLHGTTKR